MMALEFEGGICSSIEDIPGGCLEEAMVAVKYLHPKEAW